MSNSVLFPYMSSQRGFNTSIDAYGLRYKQGKNLNGCVLYPKLKIGRKMYSNNGYMTASNHFKPIYWKMSSALSVH